MKGFLLRLFGFLGIMVVLVGLMDLFFLRVVTADETVVRGDRQFWMNSDTVSVLILGDSQAMRGFDTRLVPNSFDFASDGESYFLTYYKLRDIYRRDPLAESIKTVLLAFGMHSFSPAVYERIWDGYYWVHHADYIAFGKATGDLEASVVQEVTDRYLPFAGGFKLYIRWLERIRNGEVRMVNGFCIHNGSFAALNPVVRRERIERKARHYFANTSMPDTVALEYLDKVLSLCRAHNVRVHLVSYPLPGGYFDEAVQTLGVAPPESMAASVLARHPEVDVYDDLALFRDRLDLFHNEDHLNVRGARILTKKLANEIGLPLAEDSTLTTVGDPGRR